MRSIGLALCNGFSRLGGFLAPYCTVFLVARIHTHAAELLLGGLCAAAALCAFALPYETRGRDLQAAELQPDGPSNGTDAGAAPRRHSSSGGEETADSSGCLRGVQVRHPQRISEELELEPALHEGREEAQLLRPPAPP